MAEWPSGGTHLGHWPGNGRAMRNAHLDSARLGIETGCPGVLAADTSAASLLR